MNGMRHGKGKEINTRQLFTYEGEFKFGRKNGKGIMIWVDRGDEYLGEFKDDLMHGEGTYNYHNGDYFRG